MTVNTVEVWKPVKGYENKYLVSNLGHVKGLAFKKTDPSGKTLTPQIRYGNLYITFGTGKDRKHFYIHDLVTEAFLEIRPKMPCIIKHKNNNLMDNRADNLEWQILSINNADNEVWLPVVGYENLYEVSNTGRVKSIFNFAKHNTGMLLKQRSDKWGYKSIGLTKNKTRTTYKVHQLVALAFIGPAPTPKHEVGHIDDTPSNNNAANLEWVTHSENQKQIYRNGRRSISGSLNPNAKLTENQITEIKRMHVNKVKTKDIAKMFSVNQTTINRAIKRRDALLTLLPPDAQKQTEEDIASERNSEVA